VNDQGTEDTSDDQIVGGAVFEMRLDDGDRVYEPDTGDAPVLATEEATYGFAEFFPPHTGTYWITEIKAPEGLNLAPPQLVQYQGLPENCAVIRGAAQCQPDDDNSGGFVIMPFADSPTQTVLPATPTPPGLPPTDALPPSAAPAGPPSLSGILVLIAALSLGALLLPRPKRRR
jgi:hypothetical protein